MTDFLGKELIIGDECVYLRRKRTPRGAPYIEFEKGIVIGLLEDKAIVRDAEELLPDYEVSSSNIVKVEFENETDRIGVFE